MMGRMSIEQSRVLLKSGLTGEIKNVTGVVDIRFVEAVAELMIRHRINYVQLYWSKFLTV